MNAHRRAGLTLVELLIVLAILAIMTTMAVTATSTLVDQSRYDATQRTLQSIEEAILGPPNARDPDGSLVVRGFVADIGRAPIKFGNDPLFQLAELWNNDKDNNKSPDLLPFGIRQAPSDPEVLVAGGWRPAGYLRLPVGVTDLRDGWGNAFNLGTNAPGTPIVDIVSRGADGLDGDTEGYNIDLGIKLSVPRYRLTVTGALTQYITGKVYVLDQTGQRQNPVAADTIVRFYGPDATQATGVQELPATITPAADGSVTYTITNVTIGPRALRAYQMQPGGAMPVHSRSSIERIVVQPGGMLKDLVIPYVPVAATP